MYCMIELWTGQELEFLLKLFLSLLFGYFIGIEKEARGKVAGISTHCFVIGGAMIFTSISLLMEPSAPARIAAQVVSGIGFLGAGIILKGEGQKITNLTTAASIWFAAAIGMALGFGWYVIASIATMYAIFVPRIPHLKRRK